MPALLTSTSISMRLRPSAAASVRCSQFGRQDVELVDTARNENKRMSLARKASRERFSDAR